MAAELAIEYARPLKVLSDTIQLLLPAHDYPGNWNTILKQFASSDSFYSGTTITVCRIDPDQGVRQVLGSYGPEAHELTKERVQLAGIRLVNAKLLSRLRNRRPLVVCDERPADGMVDLIKGLLPAALRQPLAIVPLVHNGRIAGAFWVEGYDSGQCSVASLQVLHILGCYISLALMADIHTQEEREMNSVLEVALDAQERERERIALDIHDGPVQMLASAFQYVQAAKDGRNAEDGVKSSLARASGLLRETMHELRGLMDCLRPATLDRFGLIASIESELQEMRQAGWQAELLADNVNLPRDRETSLYRIIHEALTNTRNHAGVCPVRVSFKRGKLCFWVDVNDWGRGFDPASLARRNGREHFGLLSMRKRTELMGGRFEIESEPGVGTHISLQIPMRRRGD